MVETFDLGGRLPAAPNVEEPKRSRSRQAGGTPMKLVQSDCEHFRGSVPKLHLLGEGLQTISGLEDSHADCVDRLPSSPPKLDH